MGCPELVNRVVCFFSSGGQIVIREVGQHLNQRLDFGLDFSKLFFLGFVVRGQGFDLGENRLDVSPFFLDLGNGFGEAVLFRFVVLNFLEEFEPPGAEALDRLRIEVPKLLFEGRDHIVGLFEYQFDINHGCPPFCCFCFLAAFRKRRAIGRPRWRGRALSPPNMP